MMRHRFDPFSFVAGLLFVAFAIYFLSAAHTPADLAAAWLWPVIVLAPGLLLVLYGVRRTIDARRGDDGDQSPLP